MLINHIHFYNSTIPKVSHTDQNHYWLSIADTISFSLAENKTFHFLEEKGYFMPARSTPPPPPPNPATHPTTSQPSLLKLIGPTHDIGSKIVCSVLALNYLCDLLIASLEDKVLEKWGGTLRETKLLLENHYISFKS